ncbi:MAG: SWIM zinc finger family protein, partial [Clostridia bacterium]|nr:SWIM zinc finger family protein [Clostridia bacterium]
MTVAEIKRHCYFSSSYSKGQELYYSKKYRNLRIIHNVADGSSEVTAEVKGSGSVWYNTRVAVSADGDDIIDYSCECASYQQTESMCKHCVAVAL